MTNEEISYILSLIDQWVNQLEQHKLNEQCRKSGASFFDFMTSRGVNPGYLAKLVIDVTGYNPRQLWTIQDAALLREAIARYEGAEALARRDDAPGSAKRWAKTMWSKRNGSQL